MAANDIKPETNNHLCKAQHKTLSNFFVIILEAVFIFFGITSSHDGYIKLNGVCISSAAESFHLLKK